MMPQLFLNFASMSVLAKDAFPVVALFAFAVFNYVVYVYLTEAESRRRAPSFQKFFDGEREKEKEEQKAKELANKVQNAVLSVVMEEDVNALASMDERALGVRVPM